MAFSISNAFDVLDLLEENQEEMKRGFSGDDLPDGDFVCVDVAQGLSSDDDRRSRFDDGDRKDGDDVDERHGSDDGHAYVYAAKELPYDNDDEWPRFGDGDHIVGDEDVLKDLPSYDRERPGFDDHEDGDEVDERRGSDDDHAKGDAEKDSSYDDNEWSGFGDGDHRDGNEIDGRRGLDDHGNVDVVKDSSSHDDAWPEFGDGDVNQPDNLPIEEDELDRLSYESWYPYGWWSDSDWYYEDNYNEEEDILFNDIFVPYEARKNLGKQRLKRMCGKKTGTTKLMKLKRMPKCCCNCQRLVDVEKKV